MKLIINVDPEDGEITAFIWDKPGKRPPIIKPKIKKKKKEEKDEGKNKVS